MTDSELTEHYRSAQAIARQLGDEVRRAEMAHSSKPSPNSLERLREARAALKRSPGSGVYYLEIMRRLHAPLKTVRLAKGMSQGEAAKRAGWSRKEIQLIESGSHWNNLPRLIRMWNALGLEVPHGWESIDS